MTSPRVTQDSQVIRITQNTTQNPSNNVFLILNLLDKLSVAKK